MTPLETPLVLIPAAFFAGILMFLAPCTLPIVPAYLAFISGVHEDDLQDPSRRRAVRWRVFYNALAFVLGFSMVFIFFGTFAAFAGAYLGEWRYVLARFGGLVLIIFGATMLGVFRLPFLSGERHVAIPKWLTLGHPTSSFLVGALFALGWSPCIGPILGSVLFVASASATVWQGALLLSVFSLGLSLPFLIAALLIGEATALVKRLAGFAYGVQILGGIILIALGVLMMLGDMGILVSWGYGLFGSWGYDRLLNYL